MNIQIVVNLIEEVCVLILKRPKTTRMERLIAEKVLAELEAISGATFPALPRQRRLGPGGVPAIKAGNR
jgi:hypothetical protein